MTEVLTFAGSHPLVFLLAIYLIGCPFRYAFKAFNRHLRSKNIAACGWPTAPIDADGDVVWPKKDAQ